MNMNDLIEAATNEHLELQKTIATDAIAEHQQLVSEYQMIVRDIQIELDRRALAAYWEAHPDLVRVQVGDKVMLTPEAELDIRTRSAWSEHSVRAFCKSPFFTIDSIDPINGTATLQFLHASMTDFDLSVVSNMRRQYLRAHPEIERSE